MLDTCKECGGDEGGMGPSRKFCGGIEAVDVGVRQGSGSARPGAGRRLTSSRISSACVWLARLFQFKKLVPRIGKLA